MTQISRSLVFAILTIALFTSACGRAAPGPDPAGSSAGTELAGSGEGAEPAGTDPGPGQEEPAAVTPSATEADSAPLPAVPSEPNPASIDITLEEGSAARGTIGPEGGSLEAVDGNGTRYTLTVPEGALISPLEISMTPIDNAEGEAIGDTFLAGVALEPEGLHFLEMATLEITGDVVQEGAVGFAAEGGGQDLHLTPSAQDGRSLVIPTSHFSILGFSEQEIIEQLKEFVPSNVDAQLLKFLSLGKDEDLLNVLSIWAGLVKSAGEISAHEEWEIWTASYNSLLEWTFWMIDNRGWNMDTPGLAGLLAELQAILDLWFEQTTAVVDALAEKCQDGELKEFIKIRQIIEVGRSLEFHLGLDREAELTAWNDLAESCLNFTLTWQANVRTTGANFDTDIALGSEYSSKGSVISLPDGGELGLEVEYIAGFWDERCRGLPGFMTLEGEVEWDTPNFGSSFDASLKAITAYVEITLNVQIDCAPAGFTISADAQRPFHGGALEEFNKDRLESDGRWKFELEYNPGGGVVAQFEEGFGEPIKLAFPTGEYEFSQLVTLYVNPSGN